MSPAQDRLMCMIQ